MRRHRAEREAHVAHLARDRSLHAHQLHRRRTLGRRRRVEGGDAAERGPDRRHAAGVGRVAQRAAEVVAVRDRADAERHRGGGAARRAARRVRVRPGILRQAAQRVVGEPAVAELRRVRATDDDRAGLAQVGDHRRVGLRDQVLVGDQPVRRRLSGLVDVLLDRHRHAVQRAEAHAAGDDRVGAFRGFEGVLRQIDRDRVDARVGGMHAVDGGLRRLDAADFAPLDRGGEVDGAPAPQGRAYVHFGSRVCSDAASGLASDAF